MSEEEILRQMEQAQAAPPAPEAPPAETKGGAVQPPQAPQTKEQQDFKQAKDDLNRLFGRLPGYERRGGGPSPAEEAIDIPGVLSLRRGGGGVARSLASPCADVVRAQCPLVLLVPVLVSGRSQCRSSASRTSAHSRGMIPVGVRCLRCRLCRRIGEVSTVPAVISFS